MVAGNIYFVQTHKQIVCVFINRLCNIVAELTLVYPRCWVIPEQFSATDEREQHVQTFPVFMAPQQLYQKRMADFLNKPFL